MSPTGIPKSQIDEGFQTPPKRGDYLRLSIFVLLVVLLLQNMGAAQKIEAPQQKTNTNTTKKVGIEFETTQALRATNTETITAGPFYYSNESDDPGIFPKTGDDNGVSFVEISSIKGDSKSPTSTQSYLNRWIQIPQPAPQAIELNFKTKVTKNENYDWAIPGKDGKIKRKVNVRVLFIRSDNVRGGGFELRTKELTQKLNEWTNHSQKVIIPENAKYLQLFLLTSSGYNIAIGDWKLKKITLTGKENIPAPKFKESKRSKTAKSSNSSNPPKTNETPKDALRKPQGKLKTN